MVTLTNAIPFPFPLPVSRAVAPFTEFPAVPTVTEGVAVARRRDAIGPRMVSISVPGVPLPFSFSFSLPFPLSITTIAVIIGPFSASPVTPISISVPRSISTSISVAISVSPCCPAIPVTKAGRFSPLWTLTR